MPDWSRRITELRVDWKASNEAAWQSFLESQPDGIADAREIHDRGWDAAIDVFRSLATDRAEALKRAHSEIELAASFLPQDDDYIPVYEALERAQDAIATAER